MTTLTLWQPYKAALPTLCMILLAGCGGGGGGASPTESPAATGPVASVVVAGDSLADVGAFGAKATIQNSADPAAGFPLFPELVAQALGVAAPCNFYRFNDTTQAFASHAGCRNFAVGSSRIVNPAERGGATVPLAIPALAGPSALATVMLLTSQAPGKLLEWVAALTVTMVVCAAVLVLAERIQQWLGERVVTAFERLMGLVLVAISVEMILAGISSFVHHL